jgi:hypothetical protein
MLSRCRQGEEHNELGGSDYILGDDAYPVA